MKDMFLLSKNAYNLGLRYSRNQEAQFLLRWVTSFLTWVSVLRLNAGSAERLIDMIDWL